MPDEIKILVPTGSVTGENRFLAWRGSIYELVDIERGVFKDKGSGELKDMVRMKFVRNETVEDKMSC